MKWSQYNAAKTVGIIRALLDANATWKDIAEHFHHHNNSTIFRWYKRNKGLQDNGSVDSDVQTELKQLAILIRNNDARINELMSRGPVMPTMMDPSTPPPVPNANGTIAPPEGYKRKTVSLAPSRDHATQRQINEEMAEIRARLNKLEKEQGW